MTRRGGVHGGRMRPPAKMVLCNTAHILHTSLTIKIVLIYLFPSGHFILVMTRV